MGGDVPLNSGLPFGRPDYKPESESERIEESIDPAAWKKVFYYAYSLVRNRAEAEDLTQDVFVVLFREQQAGRPVQRIGAWMQTVVRNLAYRRYHEQRPDLHVSLDVATEDDNRIAIELIDAAPSPEARVIDEKMLRLSAKIVYEFSERDRECILMYFRGYDFLQIAAALGVSRWTARRLTLKVLKRFQARMNPSRS